MMRRKAQTFFLGSKAYSQMFWHHQNTLGVWLELTLYSSFFTSALRGTSTFLLAGDCVPCKRGKVSFICSHKFVVEPKWISCSPNMYFPASSLTSPFHGPSLSWKQFIHIYFLTEVHWHITLYYFRYMSRYLYILWQNVIFLIMNYYKGWKHIIMYTHVSTT